MSDYISTDKLGFFLYLCAPGLILVYVRSAFLTGRMPSGSDGVLTYVTLSIIYQAILLPFTKLNMATIASAQLPTVQWLLAIFLVPAVFGTILGLNARHQWLRSLLKKISINTVHPIETAWDFRFGKITECYVMITLKDGLKWAGRLTEGSFLSTSGAERDIYVEQVYDWKDQDSWTPTGSGVWLAGSEIVSIEHWPKKRVKDNDQTRKRRRWWPGNGRERSSTRS